MGELILLHDARRPDTAHRPNVDRRFGPNAFETWSMRPWFRTATCSEAQCEGWRNGWVTTVDEGTDLGRMQADYIRHESGRRFLESRTDTGLTRFVFGNEQRCFSSEDGSHRVQATDREAVFLRAGGDHRAVIGTPYVYDRVDQFTDDLYTTTDKITTRRRQSGTAD